LLVYSIIQLTSFMIYSPRRASSHSATQEISRLLRHSEIHYRVHKGPPLFPNLSQMYPVHTTPHYIPKIHSNIILQSMPTTSEWSCRYCK